jgi:hypothetical protein
LCWIVDDPELDPETLVNRLLAAAQRGDRDVLAALASRAGASVTLDAVAVSVTGCGGELIAYAAVAEPATAVAD